MPAAPPVTSPVRPASTERRESPIGIDAQAGGTAREPLTLSGILVPRADCGHVTGCVRYRTR
jgi:hypothetical protein